MASKRSATDDGWTGRRVDMAEFGRRIAARKAALGLSDDSARPELVEGRNAGQNRTSSKRALLKAIEDAGGKW
jgi:hypothetical protein